MPRIEVDGREIRYRDGGGEGTPLLLFHAFPFDGGMWAGEIEALRDRYRVIAPDLSGFGASSVPTDVARYSVDRWADEGAAVLAACGLERAIVGGCSMGGYVSFAFVRRHRPRVAGLLLVDTRAEADDEAARAGRRAAREKVRAEGRRALIEPMADRLLAPRSRADGALRSRVLAAMEQPETGILGALHALENRPDSTPTLATIDVPTCIVVGEEDVVTPPALAEAMHRRIAGSRLVVLPGVGHLPNLEAPEAFRAAIRFPPAAA